MKVKQHEAPEFQVIKMNEANAKFYAASPVPDLTVGGSSNGSVGGTQATMTYSQNTTTGWF